MCFPFRFCLGGSRTDVQPVDGSLLGAARTHLRDAPQILHKTSSGKIGFCIPCTRILARHFEFGISPSSRPALVQVIVFPLPCHLIMLSRSTEMTRLQQSATTPRSWTPALQTLTLRSIYRRLFAAAVIGVSSSNRSRSNLLAAICSMESSKESVVETVGAPCFNVREGILMVTSRSEV